jgi:hypothetical protein
MLIIRFLYVFTGHINYMSKLLKDMSKDSFERPCFLDP